MIFSSAFRYAPCVSLKMLTKIFLSLLPQNILKNPRTSLFVKIFPTKTLSAHLNNVVGDRSLCYHSPVKN